MSTRRDFLRTTGLMGTLGFTGITLDLLQAATGDAKRTFKPLKFGIIADIHRDLTPDVDERLEAFMKQVETEKPDFIISLGDFAHALPQNESFAKRYRSAACPAYHVLGNHEHDKVTKKDAIAFLKMPAAYYSFDIAGYHCVVLDPNYIYADGKFIAYEKANYFKLGGSSYINDEQIEWLVADLKATQLPTFLFSHQTLHDNINNRAAVQKILTDENERVGFNKIIGCFNGHLHDDLYRTINGIHYFSVNSVSYYWHGEKISGRYPEELRKKFVALDNMAMYKDPLFSFVTINESGHFSLRGKKSQWEVPIPASLSKNVRITPNISDRDVDLT